MCPITTLSENHVIVIICNMNCAIIAVVSHNTYIPIIGVGKGGARGPWPPQ